MTDWYEPWQPVVGQRVRVRYRPECRLMSEDTDGLAGTVEAIDRSASNGHFYELVLGRPTRGFGVGPFAALELEPVDD